MDHLRFFRQVLHIFDDSSYPHEVMEQAFTFIQRHMPLDAMILMRYVQEKGELHIEKIRTSSGARVVNSAIFRPALETYIRIRIWKNGDPRCLFYNRLSQAPTARNFIPLLNKFMPKGEKSLLVLPLFVDQGERIIGGFVANRADAYGEQALGYAELVRMPLALYLWGVRQERARLQASSPRSNTAEIATTATKQIVGANPKTLALEPTLRHIALMDVPVLLLGETGTGKSHVARLIHDTSPRRNEPLLRVDCAALTPHEAASHILFGCGPECGKHRTGPSRVELAAGGSLFLSDVDALPMQTQRRLAVFLRFSQADSPDPPGFLHVDTRILASSRLDLAALAQDGRFDAELYSRLSVCELRLPPLRERREDILPLIHHFLATRRGDSGRTPPKIPETAVSALLKYPWPGNVRELQNLVERALIRDPQGPLRFEELLDLAPGTLPLQLENGEDTLELDVVLRRHLQHVLGMTHGRISGKTGAARLLGVHPNTLRKKLEKLHIPFRKNERPGVD